MADSYQSAPPADRLRASTGAVTAWKLDHAEHRVRRHPARVRKLRAPAVRPDRRVPGPAVLMLGGTDADFPPIWLRSSCWSSGRRRRFLAERAWLRCDPLRPTPTDARRKPRRSDVFAAQTIRKLSICEAPLLVARHPRLRRRPRRLAHRHRRLPGHLLVLAWETWPSLRNLSLTAAMLDVRRHRVRARRELRPRP